MENKNIISAAIKHKEDLIDSLKNLQQVQKSFEEFQLSLKDLSQHPRIASIIPICDYLHVDALIHTGEFHVKQGDHLALSSFNQTNEYIENHMKTVERSIDEFRNSIQLIENSTELALSVQGGERTVKTEHGTLTYNYDGTVEIMEEDNCENTKGLKRIARFKTAAERDAFLRNHPC